MPHLKVGIRALTAVGCAYFSRPDFWSRSSNLASWVLSSTSCGNELKIMFVSSNLYFVPHQTVSKHAGQLVCLEAEVSLIPSQNI